MDDGAELSGPGEPSTGAQDGRGRPKARRWVGAAVGVVVVVVVAVGLLGGDDSRPAPPMTDEARAAGAIRLTYPNRRLPPQTVSVPLEGRDPGEVGLLNVEPGVDGLVGSFVLGGVGDGDLHRVELPSGGQTDVGSIRVRVVALYDGESAKDDAIDVVLEALP